MKKNFSIIIIVILLISASFLFWKGEDSLEKASQRFTLFYFENTNLTITKTDKEIEETLTFLIENNKQKKVSYEIVYLINNQEIFKEKVEVNKNEIKTFTPPEKLITEIEKNNDDSFEYQIKTTEESDEYRLTKKISFK